MIGTPLALVVVLGQSADWHPARCDPESRLSARQVRAAEFDAERGDIRSSVSLECHYLARGEPEKAAIWLRQSGEREPLTGRRYISYRLSLGGKENCRKAYELAGKHLALKWDSEELNESLKAQQERANKCR